MDDESGEFMERAELVCVGTVSKLMADNVQRVFGRVLQANASFSQPVTVKRSTAATTTTHQYPSPRLPRDKPPLPTTLRRYLIHSV